MITTALTSTSDVGNGFAETAHPISNNGTVTSGSGSFGPNSVQPAPAFPSKFSSRSNFSADTFVRLFAGNAPKGSWWHRFWLTLGEQVEDLFAPTPATVPPVVPTPSNNATYVPVQDAQSVIESFAQGERGNCASIAAIKAALATYGTAENTFTTCKRIGDQWVITMRDKFKLTLSDEEVQQAAAEGDLSWNGDADSPDDSVLLFAAMAKRVELSGNDGIQASDMSYSKALDTLCDGEWVDEGFGWLGLRCRELSIDEYNGYFLHYENVGSNGGRSAVVWTTELRDGEYKGHAMFAAEGYKDRYGHVESIGKTESQESFVNSVAVLVKDPADERLLDRALNPALNPVQAVTEPVYYV